jgi:trimeric autotransporter adhesin
MQQMMLLLALMCLIFFDGDCNWDCSEHTDTIGPTEPPNPGPTDSYAYYPFNGNTNDVSGNGHHGMPVGNPVLTSDRFGRRDSAYQLNGIDQYVMLPAFGISTDLSVSFWIKTTATDPNTFPSGTFIVDRDVGGARRDWSVCLGLGERIQFNTGTTSGENILSSDSSVNNDVWNHIVVVRNTSVSWKGIYINGTVNKASAFDNVAFSNNSTAMCVGACGIGPSTHRCFGGLIDDVRIFSRALTINEISALFHEGGWGR